MTRKDMIRRMLEASSNPPEARPALMARAMRNHKKTVERMYRAFREHPHSADLMIRRLTDKELRWDTDYAVIRHGRKRQ